MEGISFCALNVCREVSLNVFIVNDAITLHGNERRG